MTFGRDGPYLTGHRYGRSAPAQHQDAGSHHHSTAQCPLLKDISTSALNSLLPSYDAAHISVSLQGDKPKLVGSPQESSDQAPEGKKARLDVEALLNDLAFIMKSIREDFQIHSHICKASWLIRLKLQHGFIDSALKESGNASSLLENPALALCYFPPDLPLSLVELHHITRIQEDFERIEALRLEIRSQATKYLENASLSGSTSMSTCLPFPEIIYLSLPFYHYALLRSYAPGCYGKARKRDDFRRASQSARRLFLHCGPPETFEGNQGLENFRKILVDVIPDDDAHSWISEVVAPGETKRIFVYRRHEDNHPLILALITMDNKQEDGDENEVEYTDILNRKISSIKEERTTKPTVSQRNLPILFVNFNPDRYFLVGGALCQATSGDPILQRLPGSVDLAVRLDFGYNLLEATYTIWALSKSLNALERELAMPFRAEATSCSKEIPCVGLEGGGITITDSPWPGILYVAELDFTKPVSSFDIEEKDHIATLKKQGLSEKPANTSYILKSTFPCQMLPREYGSTVHHFLAHRGFAPELYLEFSPPFELSQYGLEDCDPSLFIHLICYHLMEDLSPPPKTDLSGGWVTLDDFAEHAGANAILHKTGIKRSLDHVIGLLQANSMVHGDLRPNNVMVRVQNRNGMMQPEFRQDLNLVDIRIVDFDWAGEAGEVFYPAVRNDEIPYWPGEDGGLILASHDEEIVRAWMQSWPDYESM